MKKEILLLFIFIVSAEIAISQCNITSYGNGNSGTVEICLGDSVLLTSVGDCPILFLFNNFNNGTPGIGWSSISQAMFNNPCAPHSPDGTIYLWMGSTSTAPRYLETINFDVTQGGFIQFEMRYPLQSAASPCEGPDLFNEGVAIQYSIDSGLTWNTIEYYAPNGQVLNYIPTNTTPSATGQTPFTIWTTRNVAIPPAAITASTRFRWAQTASTSEVYDHWGLDNVKIFVPSPSISVWWNHGPTAYNPPVEFPATNKTYTVYLSDGIDTVQCSVNIIVHPIPTSDFSVSSPVCVGAPATITYLGSASSSAQYSWNFDGGSVISGIGQGPFLIQWYNQGVFNLSLILLENSCPSDVFYNTVNVIDCSSIEDIKTDALSFYTTQTESIILKTNISSNKLIVSILNVNGQTLLQQDIIQPVTEINIQFLSQGMYFIHLEGEERSLVGKFVK